ncbi:hypothetical protein LJC27_00090 [Christensenellaceae bacterium OttesenSCG-928-M15]|nr:hypothetical protein [Christensenellaceae bacterium OttesenSCG-928-M15]
MQHEQVVHKKRIFRSDGVLFVVVMVVILSVMLLLGYLGYNRQIISRPVQMGVFALMLAGCYFIITRHLTSYRYVLTDSFLTVYKSVGRKEKQAERVRLTDIRFVFFYKDAKEERGLEHGLFTGKKKEAVVVSHMLKGRRQWLIISPDETMRNALQAVCRQNVSADETQA